MEDFKNMTLDELERKADAYVQKFEPRYRAAAKLAYKEAVLETAQTILAKEG